MHHSQEDFCKEKEGFPQDEKNTIVSQTSFTTLDKEALSTLHHISHCHGSIQNFGAERISVLGRLLVQSIPPYFHSSVCELGLPVCQSIRIHIFGSEFFRSISYHYFLLKSLFWHIQEYFYTRRCFLQHQ